VASEDNRNDSFYGKPDRVRVIDVCRVRKYKLCSGLVTIWDVVNGADECLRLGVARPDVALEH